MAPHSSTLAWKIPWAKEPGRLQSMGSLRVGHDWATSLSLFTFMHRRRQPTPVFLPGESQAEPGGLPSMGSHRVGHDWSDLAVAVASSVGGDKVQIRLSLECIFQSITKQIKILFGCGGNWWCSWVCFFLSPSAHSYPSGCPVGLCTEEGHMVWLGLLWSGGSESISQPKITGGYFTDYSLWINVLHNMKTEDAHFSLGFPKSRPWCEDLGYPKKKK